MFFKILCSVIVIIIILNITPVVPKTVSASTSRLCNVYKRSYKKDQSDIRIMSYNILSDGLGFEGTPAALRKNDMFSLIHSLEPDVLGLQEVSIPWFNAFYEDCSLSFVSPLSYKICSSMTTLMYNPQTVTPVKSQDRVFKFCDNDRLRRIEWAIFRKNDSQKMFIVMNTHLSFSDKEKPYALSQATEIIELFREIYREYPYPVFLIGDFNSRKRTENSYLLSSVYEQLALYFTDTQFTAQNRSYGTEKSVYTSGPDHIFTYATSDIKSFVLLSDKELKMLSDHYPIFIDVNLENSGK